MLETRFPRPPGDIGNPETFPFPVDYRVVPRATVGRVVRAEGPSPELLDDFLQAARALADRGACLVTTSCGFLAPFGQDLSGAVGVPVVASALDLLPALHRRYAGRGTMGVLTFDATRLGAPHLPAGSGPLAIEGIEQGRELHKVIAGDLETLDTAAARADAVDAARRLVARADALSAIVLECTNLAPYRSAIAQEVTCPVFDIRDAIAGSLASA